MSAPIDIAEVPPHSLLARYVASGAYTDCYVTEVPVAVTHGQFVRAFYTTPLFRLERTLLGFLGRASSDEQAGLLAEGKLASFAAWSVESRVENQIVLAAGRTRSWLMVAPVAGAQPERTRLSFGSAVVPRTSGGLGPVFSILLGFHRLYSRALLGAARSCLMREVRGGDA